MNEISSKNYRQNSSCMCCLTSQRHAWVTRAIWDYDRANGLFSVLIARLLEQLSVVGKMSFSKIAAIMDIISTGGTALEEGGFIIVFF